MLKKALAVALLAVVILAPLRFLHSLGYFKHHFKHHPGTCSQVKGLNYGSEDFEILSNGLAFVTSGLSLDTIMPPGYIEFMEKNDIKGRIYAVDLTKSQSVAKELKIKPSNNFQPSTFRPHGISVLEDTTKGQHLLYVVNHPDGGEDRVEKFRYLPGTGELEHVRSFSSKEFHINNDIVVTGEDTYYITDYLYYKSQFLHMIETMVGIKFGRILYFNGTDFMPAVSGLMGPNGIVLSKDKRHVYLALPHALSFNVYTVNADHSLELVQEVHLDTSLDNLHVAQDGKSLYGGCHPIGVKTMQHFMDPKKHSPSQVLNLPLKNGLVDVDEITEIFYDHGDLISGSSVASIYDKKLLIGSVINKLAVCDLP